MDPFSTVVLLLLAFLAWSQDVTWLFLGALVLFVIVARSIPITVILILGFGAMYLFHLKQYWFVLAAALVGIILIMSEKQKKGTGGGEEYMSPELMQLLGGGYGGH